MLGASSSPRVLPGPRGAELRRLRWGADVLSGRARQGSDEPTDRATMLPIRAAGAGNSAPAASAAPPALMSRRWAGVAGVLPLGPRQGCDL
eukprot:776977-Pyramimonas_sp.AAC.1